MAREKWTGRLDPRLIEAMKEQASQMTRSEAYVVEMALGEMLKHKLPSGWKPGDKIDGDTD